MIPITTNRADDNKITLLFTFPVKEQTTKIIAPIRISSNPKFFKNTFICVPFSEFIF